MPKPKIALIVAAIAALLGGVIVAVRAARTERPPVSATVPRVEELGVAAGPESAPARTGDPDSNASGA
ncbi:hypothetical protein GII33_00185 [Gordonia pseudamarae]|uniref:Uncharacterized protein n=1 Tax=Gordonia pseudamarae TaxID=2831662 RepID=A0ABX6IC29_9ACTN|nr:MULTISPECIES: hypothetical protein [Gordonia]MBD0024239.1 hypothetical protein [Gordonia sp. (in: high G+C Gram-positive bacteria)]QHN24628.1 hypothetical protein GII33_00185 [Gordonia pseudamarae]QHN33559.1 hypothetical protein GII31_00185 [Gordonia pseudamarae]